MLSASPFFRFYNSAITRSNTTAQIVLFSATFPEHVRKYASKFAPNANEIKLKKDELTLEGIKQFYMGEYMSLFFITLPSFYPF